MRERAASSAFPIGRGGVVGVACLLIVWASEPAGLTSPPRPPQGPSSALSKAKCGCGGAGRESSSCEAAAPLLAGSEPPEVGVKRCGLWSQFTV